MSGYRKIIHIDMDAFYASVEQRDNPELKGKPVIIGGRAEDRGVLATASYEARKFGLRSAMSTARAFKLCPEVILLRPDFAKYKAISAQIYEIYKEFTDIIEPLSLDECYLDVTENKKGMTSATEMAVRMKEMIKERLDLTASAGVSVNKLLAKLASEQRKPDGIFVIKPEQIKSFIFTLPVKELYGVGRSALKRLELMGIKTCGDLQQYSMVELIKLFGSFGETLYYFARGYDDRPVVSEHEVKSIGSEHTLPIDSGSLKIIKDLLYEELKIVVARLKSAGLKARTVTVKVKYADFVSSTRSKSLPEYTDEFVYLFEICLALLAKTEVPQKKIRLIGASLSNFEREPQQPELNFFD